MTVHIGDIGAYRNKNILAGTSSVFLAGNFEAQRLACSCIRGYPKELKRFPDTVRENFVYSCLLSDDVIQPNAHYYQSEITRWITKRYKLLFKAYKGNPPIASYGLSYRKNSYAEDAEEKAITYIKNTSNFPCYHDSIIRSKLTNELNSLAKPHIRFGNLATSLSELMTIESQFGGELFTFVYGITRSDEDTKTLLSPLRDIAEERKYALVPEYLSTKTPPNLPSYYVYLMRLTLLKCYMQIVEQLYGAPVENALYPYYRGILLPYELRHTDTQLFGYFMGLIPDTRDVIRRMSAKELLELKWTDSFQHFLYYYKSFIENLGDANIDEYKEQIVKDYEFQKDLYHLKVKEVLNNQTVANMLCRSVDETAKNRQMRLTRTKDIFSYREIPIYALVSEVVERFANRYERMLNTNLESWRYDKKRKKAAQRTFRRIFTGGIQMRQNANEQFKKDHPGRTAVVMMTFPRGTAESEASDRKLENVYERLKSRLLKYGIEAVRADKKNYATSDWLWDNVRIYLEVSNVSIAVLEGLFEDEMNPNVAVEYGYTMALGKSVLLLKEKAFKRIRADLLGKLWVEFDINSLESVDKAVDQWMINLGVARIEL